jgi:PAS domain S-box-containing protein
MGARILIIDDDDGHLRSLRMLLESAGHDVVGEGAGEDVPRLLDLLPAPDLVVLDLIMPGVDGFEVLDGLAQRDDVPPVIVLTGSDDPDELRRLVRLGAADCLTKPYEAPDLLRAVDDALERRAARERSEQHVDRVRASDRLHRFLVEQSPDVIYMLDVHGRFTFLSASSGDVFGQSPEALLGHHWSELFAPGEQERAQWRFNERRTGPRATRNLELRLAGGGTGPRRWIRVSATGIYGVPGDDPDATERFDGTYGIARDVTETRAQDETRAALESQLEQSRRMEAIGQLAGGIAHDFNNILASMIGYAELAQMTLEDQGETGAEYLAEVVGAGQRARDLVAQLLNFSRPAGGSARSVRLDTEVDGVTRMLRAVIPSTVTIRREIDPTPLAVDIDPAQLQQVVLNLIINARDALDGEGTITVRVGEAHDQVERPCLACGERFGGDRVVLEVSDDGPGIEDEIGRRLFDPLVSARPGTRGTGFGLTVVQDIVHRHGGHLEVDSAAGRGTTFRLHFPAGTALPDGDEDEVVPATPPLARRRAEGHVVVVDDEVSVANFLRQLLEHSGYEVTVFNDPETALEFLEASVAGVDLVITDQTMPRLTGIDLSRRIAAFDAPPPVILCTGYGHEMASGDADTLAAVLPKPFEIRELLAEVARHLPDPQRDEDRA